MKIFQCDVCENEYPIISDEIVPDGWLKMSFIFPENEERYPVTKHICRKCRMSVLKQFQIGPPVVSRY